MQATDFTENKDVREILDELKSAFSEENPLVISDVLDNEGFQYVNLVQEGGGVLGIALVGYTYVLEQLGIRFLKLAGTSAGAINTMLLASIDSQPGRTKSERIIDYLANLDMFSFVDGHWFARWLIRFFITSPRTLNRIKNIFTVLGIVLIVAFVAGMIGLWVNPALSLPVLKAVSAVLLVLSLLGLFGYYLFSRFRRSRWGINPGHTFLNTISGWLSENGVETLADFEEKKVKAPAGLKMREGRNESISDLLKPDLSWVTLITSEITTQIKIEFPRMWCLYRTSKTDIRPAEFVRASMSVPIFFEPYEIDKISVNDPGIKQCWKENINYTLPLPRKVKFVDGGILSNFPINIFYNPRVQQPRMPTLGILLDDEEAPATNDGKKPNLLSFLFSMFNTVRFYYDKDFQIKHNDFEKTIGRIDVKGINWLDFGLSDEAKIDLFVRGVRAARDFLLGPTESEMTAVEKKAVRANGFNWQTYKAERAEMYAQLTDSSHVIKVIQPDTAMLVPPQLPINGHSISQKADDATQ